MGQMTRCACSFPRDCAHPLPLEATSQGCISPGVSPKLGAGLPLPAKRGWAARFRTCRSGPYSAAARAGAAFSTSAAAFATRVPSKKRGFCVPQSRTALAKAKSRKSSGVMKPSSTSS